MGIFTLNFIIAIVWIGIYKILPISKDNRILIFLSIIYIQFVCLYIFRDLSVGVDTINYATSYDYIINNELGIEDVLLIGWEPGYLIVNLICAKIGLSFYGFLLVTALFCYYSVLRFIYKYSSDVGLSILIFISVGYYFHSLHILRQFWALSIILYSYDFILSNRPKQFIILILIAFTFHNTALLFLFTYFIRNYDFSILKFTSLYIATVLCALAFGQILMHYLISVDVRYASYASLDDQGSGFGMLLFLSGLSYLGLFMRPAKLDGKFKLLYLLMLVGTLLQIFAPKFSLVSRLIWYWNISIVAYCPMLIKFTKNQNTKLILTICMYTMWIVFFFFTNRQEGIVSNATYTPIYLSDLKLFQL